MYDDEVDSYGCRWRWAILSLQCMGHERVHGTDMLNSIQCTLIAPSHAMGIYTILFCSPQPSHARVRSSSIAASQETTNKVTRQLRLRILLLPEVLEHMRQLFPVIECFLLVVPLISTPSVPIPSPFTSPAAQVVIARTWNSICDFVISTSTVCNCCTYLCLSNSCRIFVRIVETGRLSEYID